MNNNKLIERLTEIKDALTKESEGDGIVDTLWMNSGTETIFDALDSVL